MEPWLVSRNTVADNTCGGKKLLSVMMHVFAVYHSVISLHVLQYDIHRKERKEAEEVIEGTVLAVLAQVVS